MSRAFSIGSALLLLGCASTPQAVTPEATPQPPEPVEPALVPPDVEAAPPASAPAPASTPAELAGAWVEYWAVSGATDTQRYRFGADGRFEWHAAPATPDLARRWGSFRIDGEELVLSCEGHERRGDCKGAACTVADQPPVEHRLQLGECPPNVEAKALDANYRCLSIAGHAFWRRSGE